MVREIIICVAITALCSCSVQKKISEDPPKHNCRFPVNGLIVLDEPDVYKPMLDEAVRHLESDVWSESGWSPAGDLNQVPVSAEEAARNIEPRVNLLWWGFTFCIHYKGYFIVTNDRPRVLNHDCYNHAACLDCSSVFRGGFAVKEGESRIRGYYIKPESSMYMPPNNSLKPTTPAPHNVMPLAMLFNYYGVRKTRIGYDHLGAWEGRKWHAVARLGVAA